MADSMMTVDEDTEAEEEFDDYDDDDDDEEGNEGGEEAEDDAEKAPGPATTRRPSTPHFVAEDVAAEVITGVGHLSLRQSRG